MHSLPRSLMLLMSAFALWVAGCTGTPEAIGSNPLADAADPGETLVYSFPGDLPEWVYTPGVGADALYQNFTGISRKFSTEVEGRKDAVRNAREQIADFLRTDVKRSIREVSAYVGVGSDIIDPATVSDDATRLAAEVTLLGTAAQTFYTEKWRRSRGKDEAVYWKVYALVKLPRDAEFDLTIGALEARLKGESDAKTKRNLELAIQRLEELKARGWFADDSNGER